VLTFNTRTKAERGKDARCSLMRLVPGSGGEGEGEEEGEGGARKKLASLKGYVLSVGASARGGGASDSSCRLSILNTSDIKQHREVCLDGVFPQ
jgi:hypothetical protein